MPAADTARALQSAITEIITPTSATPGLRTVVPTSAPSDITSGLIAAFDAELTRAKVGQNHEALVGAYNSASQRVATADASVVGAIKKSAADLKAVDRSPLDAAIVAERQAVAQPRLDNSAESLAAQRALIDKQAAIADAQRVARGQIMKQAGVDPTQSDSLINQELNRVATMRIALQNQEKSVIGTALAALLSGGRVGADQNGNIVGLSNLDATQKQIDSSYAAIRAATSAADQAIPFAEMVAADSLGGVVDEQRKAQVAKAVAEYNQSQNEVRAGKISDARINTILADTSYSQQYKAAHDQGNLGIQAAQAGASSVKSAAEYAIGAARAGLDRSTHKLSDLASRIGMAERQDKQALEAGALEVANLKRVQLGLEPVTPAALKMMQPKDRQLILDQGASVAFGGTFDESMGMIQATGFNAERMKQQGNAKDAAQLQLFQRAVRDQLDEQMSTDATGAPKHPDTYAVYKKLTQEQRVRAVAAKLSDEWDSQSADMSRATEHNPRKINFKTYAMLLGTRPDLVKPLTDAGVVDEIIKMNGPENIDKKDVLPKAFDSLLARVVANPKAMDAEVKKFTDTFSMLTRMQATTSGYPQYGLPFDGDYRVNVGGRGSNAKVVSFTNPAQIKAMLAVKQAAAHPGLSYAEWRGGIAPVRLPQDPRGSIQRLAEDN